jgi:hypothetical protein
VDIYILVWVMIPPLCILDMGAHRVDCVCAEAVSRGLPLDQECVVSKILRDQSLVILSLKCTRSPQEFTLTRFHFFYRQGDSDPIFAWWPRRLDVDYSALKYLHPQIYVVVTSRYFATLKPYT